MSNTFGKKFRLTTYGESHGLAVGGIIDGCPSQMHLNMEAIKADLTRRRTGAARQEEDEVEWLSGLKDGITLGTPIAFAIRNKNTHSEDYDALRDAFRPGHADFTYHQKYGIRDHRGGGRSSARETVARVVAGAIAKQVIAPIEIHAEVSQLGPEREDDTRGGIVSCRITGLPAGVGDPIFEKLNAHLAFAMMSIPSAIGFEMGAGFKATEMNGSEYIDRWQHTPQSLRDSSPQPGSAGDMTCDRSGANLGEQQGMITVTNHCGGVQGGISNGMPVEFRVAFHPVVTLPLPVECLTEKGDLRTQTIGGRHDRCHVLRTPVIVEAMAALTIANYVY